MFCGWILTGSLAGRFVDTQDSTNEKKNDIVHYKIITEELSQSCLALTTPCACGVRTQFRGKATLAQSWPPQIQAGRPGTCVEYIDEYASIDSIYFTSCAPEKRSWRRHCHWIRWWWQNKQGGGRWGLGEQSAPIDRRWGIGVSRQLKKMRKCPPGTCSVNAINVKFGNTTLHWQCFKCIIIREFKIWMIFEYPWCSNIYDVRISMMSKYPWCPNICNVQISMMS